MYSYCFLCRDTELFQMQDLFAFRIPKRGIRILLPVCPSPGLVSQFFPEEPVSGRPVPLWQLLGVPAAICPWLSSSAWGLQDTSATPAQALRFLFWQWVGKDFFPSPPYFFLILFCLCFCCCCSIYTYQNCHAGLPLPPTAVRPLLQGDLQSQQETNNVGKKFQSVFRETCYFKGSREVPLELITVVCEIRQGGSCSVGSQEMEKMEKEKIKNKRPTSAV